MCTPRFVLDVFNLTTNTLPETKDIWKKILEKQKNILT